MSRVLMEGSFYPYRCVHRFGPAARWTQSGTNAAPDRIPNRHLLHPRPPCIAQVTACRTTAIRAEVARAARHRQPRIIIEAVDPRGTTRRPRNGVNVGVAAPSRPRCAPIDVRGPATKSGIATERDRASTREGTDRVRDRAEDPARETKGEVAVVIAAETETDIDTGRAAGTTPGRPRTSPMFWKITARGRGQRCIKQQWSSRSRTPSRTMVALWRCSRRCRNKCSQPRRNLPLRY